MPWIKVGILAMYMPLNMDTFHPSLSTKTSGETIFKKFDFFWFVDNFECLACGSYNISTIVSSINNTRTPSIIDFITSILDPTIPWMNYFTRGWMGVSSRLRIPPTLTYFAQATSLPTIHMCRLSISIKMTFLSKMDTIYLTPKCHFKHLHLKKLSIV